MRFVGLYLRSRRVPLAVAIALGTVGLTWVTWPFFSDGQTVNTRMISVTVLIAAVALGTTLSGADDALDHSASARWPARRAVHLLLTVVAVVALLLVTTVTDVRYEPLGVVVRNTAGLLGLTALGAVLLGAALSWIAPLTWTLVAIMPWMGPSEQLRMQLGAWLIQPGDSTAATVCALVLSVTGLVAYTVRGCPLQPATETAPNQ
ncbi:MULTISPECIES: hypothetical protein [unclassified Solwaraspora]|uniref:hypothetical protein n=1 Tax=unclassified Solwaraspora TaxID=2627926 RepID=UPI00259B3985|nr:hypothetical protein [Solwaraspora sp. WMMA2056]WJK39980.1 hypothetical protein O7608_26665 [Solwaraspora sp. WMMA2056]